MINHQVMLLTVQSLFLALTRLTPRPALIV
nr:MAG TPA: hypothetical protein [Caudoviricetes sp.]